MARLKVARMGNPVLVQRARAIPPQELSGERVQRLIDDMIETMEEERGVGLAAPQVYESLRLFIMDPGAPEGEGGGLRVVVNPVLAFREDDERIQLWEGCLSIPGIRGLTERHAVVDLEYLDREGRAHRVTLRDFPAAVAQHEFDHLEGQFFFSRMPDLTRIAFEDELARLADDEGEDGPGDDEGEARPV